MGEQQKNPLADERIGKLIAKFTIPSIISMLVSSLYNIVDQVFIGRGVGMLGNAATNVAFPVSAICTATALLLGIGAASNYNLRSGEGKDEEAKKMAGCGLSMLVICGVIFMVILLVFLKPLMNAFGATEEVMPYALDYTGITAIGVPFLILTSGGCHLVRADRNPAYSMACMLSGAIINIVLDPVFIFVCGWGIRGAAFATILGQIVSGVMILFYFAKKSHMKIKKQMLIPRAAQVRPICALGLAGGINQVAIALVQIAMNNVLRHYGEMSVYGSDIPLACVGVISKLNLVFLSICIGVSQGCQPIFGFNYGAKNYSRVRETYRRAATICVITGICFFACFQLFPRPLVSIFGTGTEEYYEFSERYLRIFMMMTFINGIQPMSAGFFTSIGKAVLGMLVSLTRQIFFLLPLILIFPIFMGINGVMYTGPIADAAASALTILFVIKQVKIMKQKE